MKKYIILLLVLSFTQIKTANAQFGGGNICDIVNCSPIFEIRTYKATLQFVHSYWGYNTTRIAEGSGLGNIGLSICQSDRQQIIDNMTRYHLESPPPGQQGYFIWRWYPVSTPNCVEQY